MRLAETTLRILRFLLPTPGTALEQDRSLRLNFGNCFLCSKRRPEICWHIWSGPPRQRQPNNPMGLTVSLLPCSVRVLRCINPSQPSLPSLE